MKITIEFGSIKDMLTSLPKFAQLIAGDGPAEERAAAAMEDGAPVIKIEKKDGTPFTEEEKERVRTLITQGQPKPVSEVPAEEEEPKPKKKSKDPALEKDPIEATETGTRKALNDLVKARSAAAVKLIFKELGVANFGELTEATQYAEALALAEKVSAMTDEEYKTALKEAGIKGGKK